MNLYNIIPFLSGYKSFIAGAALICLGLGGMFTAVGDCLMTLELKDCYEGIANAWEPLVTAFAGLGVIGIGHKMEKASPSK